MIEVRIKPRTDRRYDIHVYNGSISGELLVHSSQGYENAADAESIVRRLFCTSVEPVSLTVTHLDGTGTHRWLR